MLNARLISIANRASRLHEQLEAILNCLETGDSDRNIDQSSLQKEWMHVVADSDPIAFNKRLSKLSVQPKQLHQLFANDKSMSFKSLPTWIQILEEIIQIADTFSWAKIEAENFEEEQQTPPFSEVLWPFAVWALQQLYQTCPSANKILSEAAKRELFQHLLEQLSWLSAKVFALKLNVARVLGKLRGKTPESRYHYFVTHILKGSEGLLQTFAEYPVLARLLVTVSNNWTQAQVKLLSRLRDDRDILFRVFGIKPIDRISKIDLSLSDPHFGHKTVCKLEFASGLEIIYKPRSIQNESLFQDFINWCNQAGNLPDFKIIKTISKNGYGWSEYVPLKPCNSISEVERYYYRQGMNLCLMLGWYPYSVRTARDI